MRKIAIVQSNYVPWKGYFDMIASVDRFIIYDDVQFTKNDWRNRNRIKVRTGIDWLSIPVRQEALGQRINQTRVSDMRWPARHWRTLAHSYARAKYFHIYAPYIEEIYRQVEGLELLSEINLLFLRRICALLEIDTEICLSQDFLATGNRVERLVNICREAGADHYLSGPAAKQYLDENAFLQAGIEVEWMDYQGYPEYEQLFPPFQHAVSILDLLFNTGTLHKTYMKTR